MRVVVGVPVGIPLPPDAETAKRKCDGCGIEIHVHTRDADWPKVCCMLCSKHGLGPIFVRSSDLKRFEEFGFTREDVIALARELFGKPLQIKEEN